MRPFFLVLCLSSALSPAAEFTWSGDSGRADWNSPSSWTPAGTPGVDDAATLTSARAPSTIVLKQDLRLKSLTFDPGALHSCTLEGHSLTLTDAAEVKFSKLPGDVGTGKTASQIITSNLRLSGRVTFANQNRLYLGGEKLQLMGALSGDGSFLVKGTRHGIVQLSGDNSGYHGAFQIETGSLMVSHSAGLGSGKQAVRLNGGAVVIGARVSTTHDFLVVANSEWDSHGPNGTHDGTITIGKDATLNVRNGGGNTMTWRGAITGTGDLRFSAHGTTFGGEKANTLSGTVTVGGQRGATIMARSQGVDVIAGPLVMSDRGTLRWEADDQIADSSPVTFAGKLPTLDLNGRSERLGVLTLQSDGRINLGSGDSKGRLSLARSDAANWTTESVLMILNGGVSRGSLRFGTDDGALTKTQLAQIGFVDPVGFPRGTYTAKLDAKGVLIPTGTLVAPIDLPVDLSPEASERRRKIYQVSGLANLTGPNTPLKKSGMVISVYGDSITWGGGFLKLIKNSLDTGEGTKDLTPTLINHGVNGGGVLTIRDGDKGTAHFGNTKPLPFAETIAADKADLAVIFIGVNDVWWRKTPPEFFEQSLRDLVTQARANKTIPVLATLAILREEVGKRNPKCDSFAEITRKVAKETKTTLVDLRAAFMACMECESIVVRPGGAWTSNGKLLTHDGVHANTRGEKLIANHIAQGIFEALGGER